MTLTRTTIIEDVESVINTIESVAESVITVAAPQDLPVLTLIKKLTQILEAELNLLTQSAGAKGATGPSH